MQRHANRIVPLLAIGVLPVILPRMAAGQAAAVSPGAIAFAGATVIDGTGAPPVENATVVVEDGRITCVGECALPPDAQHVDVSGSYILPGLVDVHVHYGLTGWVDAIPGIFGIDVSDRFPYPEVLAGLREHPKRLHRSYLCSGVTAVYEPGGFAWGFEVQEGSEGSTGAPHYATAGPILTGMPAGPIAHPDGRPMSVRMTSPEQVRRAVRRLAEMGSESVKLHRPDFIADRDRRRKLLEAAGEEADRYGLRIIGNTPNLEVAKELLRAGASLFIYPVEDTLVDDEFIDLARCNDLIYAPTFEAGVGRLEVEARRFREGRLPLDCVDPETRRKAFLTDSLPSEATGEAEIIPEQDPGIRAVREENLRRLHEAGIAIAIGSGGGAPLNFHGPATVNEMEAMAAAGMEPMEVLVAGTRNGARAMLRSGFGTLEPGKLADLIVVDRDPLEDISNLHSVRLVVRAGRVWSRDELEYR